MIELIVSMVDKITGPAKSAGTSMVAMSTQAKTLQGAITSAERAMVKASALGNTKGYDKAAGDLGKFKAALAEIPQATGGASSGVGGLSGMLEELGAVGPEAFIGLGLAAAAALGAVVVAGAGLALQATELREKLVATFDSLGGGAGAGEKMVGTLNEMAARLPQTRAQLGEWAKTLMAAGVSASAVPGKLEAIASAQAMLGTEGADKLAAAMAKLETKGEVGKAFKMGDLVKLVAGVGVTAGEVKDKLKEMGVTGAATNEQVSKALELAAIGKGKGALANMAGSLSSMGDKFKENISMLFEGVDVKPFTAGLKSVLDLFSQSTASGKAMKSIVTGTFNAIFAVASAVFPVIKSMILSLVIVALRIYIAMKPAIGAFKSLVGAVGGVKMITTALKGLLAIVAVVAAVLGVGLLVVMAPLLLIVGAVAAVGAAFSWLVGTAISVVSSVLGAMSDLASGGLDAASNLISGLVSGISSGTGAVVDAMKALASSGISALKGALGIHSPSKVMMQMGGHTATGMAQGLDQGAGKVASSAEGLADAASGGAAPQLPKGAPASGGAAKGASAGVTINLSAGAIQIKGAGSDGQALSMTEQAVANIFDRIAAKEGLAA